LFLNYYWIGNPCAERIPTRSGSVVSVGFVSGLRCGFSGTGHSLLRCGLFFLLFSGSLLSHIHGLDNHLVRIVEDGDTLGYREIGYCDAVSNVLQPGDVDLKGGNKGGWQGLDLDFT